LETLKHFPVSQLSFKGHLFECHISTWTLSFMSSPNPVSS